MMCVVMPAMAVPTNTSNTFPNDELMQADYTYTNQATYENTGVYSDSVDAEANYEYIDITVPAGKYLPAGYTTVQTCPSGSYCPGLAQPVHYDAQNAQGKISCSSLGGGYYSNDSGLTSETQCKRVCKVANMGTTIPNYPHAAVLGGLDYYGGTENDTCTVTVCEKGYHVDNNTCAVNIITINWNGATAAAISANNAGTTVYGGDIRTPQSIDPSQVPAGKRFVGWKFVKLFDLSTLDASIGGTSLGFQGSEFSENTSEYGLISDNTWGITFSYGKIRGEARCSTKYGNNNSNQWGATGGPNWTATESELTGNGTGPYCWCKPTQYQANGSSEWQNVLLVPWVFLESIPSCEQNCAVRCAVSVTNSANFRIPLYGIIQ